jgi:hypothetical protein
VLQFGVVLALAAGGLSAYIITTRLAGLRDPIAFIPLYFGQAAGQPDLGPTALAAFPAWLFWSWLGATFYSLLLIAILYLRLPHGNTLYLITATFMIILSFLNFIFFYNSIPMLLLNLVAFFIGIAQLVTTLNLWHDFTFKEYRLQLKVDRDAKTHMTLFISGREYSKLRMWGLAAIHLRRAVAADFNNPSYQLALAVAYMNIKREDLAEKALAQAEKLDPQAGEIWRRRQQLKHKAG